ncbi:hypothetical protein AAIB33_11520 [Microbacterium sp. AZCO]|uniref:hypothetical protein n=1 Tax=Microbacterium sp. AZCO TaxID=3142976 RepID=UPI0031F33F07
MSSPPAAPPVDPDGAGPRTKRHWLAWSILGAIALALIVLAILLVPLWLKAASEARTPTPAASAGLDADEQAAVAAVQRYDDAWARASCRDYLAATTEAFRARLLLPECPGFTEEAESFAEGSDDYHLEVDAVSHEGEKIIVSTTETYVSLVDDAGAPLAAPAPATRRYDYVVIPSDSTWVIDDANIVLP